MMRYSCEADREFLQVRQVTLTVFAKLPGAMTYISQKLRDLARQEQKDLHSIKHWLFACCQWLSERATTEDGIIGEENTMKLISGSDAVIFSALLEETLFTILDWQSVDGKLLAMNMVCQKKKIIYTQ
jgi:hypothetical protein